MTPGATGTTPGATGVNPGATIESPFRGSPSSSGVPEQGGTRMEVGGRVIFERFSVADSGGREGWARWSEPTVPQI